MSSAVTHNRIVLWLRVVGQQRAVDNVQVGRIVRGCPVPVLQAGVHVGSVPKSISVPAAKDLGISSKEAVLDLGSRQHPSFAILERVRSEWWKRFLWDKEQVSLDGKVVETHECCARLYVRRLIKRDNNVCLSRHTSEDVYRR